MWIKKFVGTVLFACVVCFTPIVPTAQAAEPYGIVTPLYDNTEQCSCDLRISASYAYCTGLANSSKAVKITAEQYLQKQGFLWIWTTYDSAEWTKTKYTNTLTMSNTKTGLSSGKYRLKTIFTLTDKNGETETITVYSDEKSAG